MATTVTGVCYNNTYASGTPTIPGSPTAFSGLTAGTYTQTINTVLALVTATVPASSMGLNGCLEWDYSYSYNNDANSKTTLFKLSSISPGVASTTFGTGRSQGKECNAGSASAQAGDVWYTSPTANTVLTGPVIGTRNAVNTAVVQSALITEDLVTAATDTAGIERFTIRLTPN